MLCKILATVLFAGWALLGTPALFIVASFRQENFANQPYDDIVAFFNDAVDYWISEGSQQFKGVTSYSISIQSTGVSFKLTEVDGQPDPPFAANTQPGYPAPLTYDFSTLAARYVFNNSLVSPALFPPVNYTGSPLFVSALFRGPGGPYSITAPAVFPSSYLVTCSSSSGVPSQDDDNQETCSCPIGTLSADGSRCHVLARLTAFCLNVDTTTHFIAYSNISSPGCAPLPMLPDGSILQPPPTGSCLKSGPYAFRLSPFVYTVSNDPNAGKGGGGGGGNSPNPSPSPSPQPPQVISFADFSIELRSSADPYSIGLALTAGTRDFGTAPGGTYRAAVVCWVLFGLSLVCLIALLLCIYTSWFDACVEKRKSLRHAARAVRAHRKRMQLEAAAASAAAEAGDFIPAGRSESNVSSRSLLAASADPMSSTSKGRSIERSGSLSSNIGRASNRFHLLRHPLLRDISIAPDGGMMMATAAVPPHHQQQQQQHHQHPLSAISPHSASSQQMTLSSSSSPSLGVAAAALANDGFSAAAADLLSSSSSSYSSSSSAVVRSSKAALSNVPASTVAIISSSGRSLLGEEEEFDEKAGGPNARPRNASSASAAQHARNRSSFSAINNNNHGVAVASEYNRGPSASFVMADGGGPLFDGVGAEEGGSFVDFGGGFVVTDDEWRRILEKAPPPQGVPLSHWENMTIEERELAYSDDLHRSNWHWGALGVSSSSSSSSSSFSCFSCCGGGRGGGCGALELCSCCSGRLICRIPLFVAVFTVSFLSWLAFMQSVLRGCCPRMPGVTRRQTIAAAKVVAGAAAITAAALGGVFVGSASSTIVHSNTSGGGGGQELDPSGPTQWICAYSSVCGSLASIPDSCASISQAAAIDLLPQLPVIRGLIIAGVAIPPIAIAVSALFVDRGLYATENTARRSFSVIFACAASLGILFHWAGQALYYLGDTADEGAVAYCSLSSNVNASECIVNTLSEQILNASTGVSVVTGLAVWIAAGLFLSDDAEEQRLRLQQQQQEQQQQHQDKQRMKQQQQQQEAMEAAAADYHALEASPSPSPSPMPLQGATSIVKAASAAPAASAAASSSFFVPSSVSSASPSSASLLHNNISSGSSSGSSSSSISVKEELGGSSEEPLFLSVDSAEATIPSS